jgi:hypothetical protein
MPYNPPRAEGGSTWRKNLWKKRGNRDNLEEYNVRRRSWAAVPCLSLLPPSARATLSTCWFASYAVFIQLSARRWHIRPAAGVSRPCAERYRSPGRGAAGAHCRFDAPAFQRPWAKASSRPDPFCSILRCSAVTGDGRSVATTDSFSPSRHQSPVTSHYKIGNRKRLSFFTSAWIFSLCECEEYVLPLFRWNN